MVLLPVRSLPWGSDMKGTTEVSLIKPVSSEPDDLITKEGTIGSKGGEGTTEGRSAASLFKQM